MGRIGKSLVWLLTLTTIVSCLTILTVTPVNAQSTSIPEITILNPTNGTFFNVSRGVDSFQLKYAINITPLSWIGYSIDGGQNRTAYGAWFNFNQILHEEDGNLSVRVSGVFESDGNHNLTLYANNTSGDWAIPQTVTYLVNMNLDTTIPPTTSKPPTMQSTRPSATVTPFPTPVIITENVPNYPLLMQIILTMAAIISIIVLVTLYSRHRKTSNSNQ